MSEQKEIFKAIGEVPEWMKVAQVEGLKIEEEKVLIEVDKKTIKKINSVLLNILADFKNLVI